MRIVKSSSYTGNDDMIVQNTEEKDHVFNKHILSFMCPICHNKTVYDVDKDVYRTYEVSYDDLCVCEECGSEMYARPQYDGSIRFEVDVDESTSLKKKSSKIFSDTTKRMTGLQQIVDNCKKAAKKFMMSPRCGFPKDEVDDYLFVEGHRSDDGMIIEVRAELSYSTMRELAEKLDPIVQKYDPDAYFDDVDSGIIEAFIQNLSGTRSGQKEDVYSNWEDPYFNDDYDYWATGENRSQIHDDFIYWYDKLSEKDRDWVDDLADTEGFPLYDNASDDELSYLMDAFQDRGISSKTSINKKKSILSSRLPKYWNTTFRNNVIKDYNSGKLTLDNIDDWEKEYNGGIAPNPKLGTKEILEYYIKHPDSVKSSSCNSIRSSEDVDPEFEEYEDDIKEIDQEFTSENTSINSTKLPAVFKMVSFAPGTVNIDYGGGRFDNVADYLSQYDVINLVYDPYNRTPEHNKEVIKMVKEHGGADSATCSNVLNVIKEKEVRLNVLNNIKKLVKPNGDVYITVYEGTGKGNEGATKSGYQLNRKTADYLEEIQQVFPDATRKGKLIVAHPSGSVKSAIDLSNYGPGYVEIRDDDPTFVYDDYNDARRGVSYSKSGDSMYGLGIHDYKIKYWDGSELSDLEETDYSNSVNSASYGGAYDIEDDMFFTKEELMEFAYEVADRFDKWEKSEPEYASEQQFDVADVSMDDKNNLYLDLTDNDLYISGMIHIDMRRIRKPSDINRYQDEMLAKLKADYINCTSYLRSSDDIVQSSSIEAKNDKLDFQMDGSDEVMAGWWNEPEPPIDPPEDDYEEKDPEEDSIEVTFDDVVTISDDGTWEYEKGETQFSDVDCYAWNYSSIRLDDNVGIMEKIDELLLDELDNKEPGVYKVTCDVELQYVISGIMYKVLDRWYSEEYGYDEDVDEYTDSAEVDWDNDESKITNLSIEKIK